MISWLAKIVFFHLMGWKIEGEFPFLKKVYHSRLPTYPEYGLCHRSFDTFGAE